MLRSIVFSAICVGLLTAFSATSAAAETDWTGWLGPERDGWVEGFEPPAEWPEQLQHDWTVEVGTGYSSPLVVGDSVYQQARQGDEEVLWCLDLAAGDVRWRKSHAVPFKIGGGGEWHGKGPKSSPVYADGRIFTMSISGILSAWNAETGEQLWRRDDGSRFKLSHPYWGAATSPVVDEDRVIVHFGTDEAGVLVALSTETGEEIWRLGDDGPSYSSPLLATIDGVRQVIEWNHRALVGVDSRNGELLWEYPFPHAGSNQNMPTPTLYNGQVLVGGENRGILAVQPNRHGDEWTVSKRWHQEDVALDMSTAVINDDLLFGFSHYGRGRMFCLDPASGDVLWQGPGRTGANVMFLSIPGHLVALIDDGELRIIKATGKQYQPVASYEVAESPTWAPPVLLPDAVLVKDRERLIKWAFPAANR